MTHASLICIVQRFLPKKFFIKKSKCLTISKVAEIFNIPESKICDFVEFDPAYAIKFTIYRSFPSGSPGDGDVFGCQQYPPLLDIEIPVED